MESSRVTHTIADIQQKIKKVEIVWSRYNDEIVTMLKNSCLNRLNKINDKLIDVNEHDVPGAYELPVLAKNLILRRQPDVIIALGAIISETAHFEIVANSCSHSLSSLSTSYGLPIIFGVLTVENMEQAIYGADPNKGDKGGEALYRN